MPLQIVRNDITTMQVDVIVNAANNTLLGGGGVDGMIHAAAGPELLEACRTLGGCETGDAKITKGYRLPARYVIHTVGPIWRGGAYGEKEKLISCYRRSLEIAESYGLGSVAFPLISAGVYGYPKDQALDVAVTTIKKFHVEHDTDLMVYLVIYDKTAFRIGSGLYDDIAAYIDDRYVDQHTDMYAEGSRRIDLQLTQAPSGEAPRASRPPYAAEASYASDAAYAPQPEVSKSAPVSRLKKKKAKKTKETQTASLEEKLQMIDESFSEMLLRKIDASGMTDAECYKKANIDRKLFSKIRSNPAYKPSKSTVLAFAIALELSLDETREMLMKAGFSLSHSSKFDLIVEYFIEREEYDIFKINEALFAFDQNLLGSA